VTNDAAKATELTVIDFFRVVRRYRWWVAAATFGCVALAVLYVLMATPLYSAKVVMIPQTPEGGSGLASRLGGLGGLMSLANIDLDSGTGKEEAIAVLTSRQFTDAFITEHNLVPQLYPDLWDNKAQRWIDPEKVPSMGSVYTRFDQKIRFVSTDNDTGVVTLEILWRDPKQAADWANDLVRRLNQRTRDLAVKESQDSLDYLNEQLTRTEIMEVRSAMFGLIEHHINRIMMAKIRSDYAFKVIDPAVAPDAARYVSPRPVLTVALAMVFGLMLGLALAIARFLILQESMAAAAAAS
jgi:uncharacterized protein involved in exopolysaccharide biosynthesis